MRKAAGIMLIIVGIFVLIVEIINLRIIGIHFFPFSLLSIIFAALIVTGGICCIRKKYWGLCLASALFAVYIMIRALINNYSYWTWEWVMCILGILPIIFVCITRKEWKEIQG